MGKKSKRNRGGKQHQSLPVPDQPSFGFKPRGPTEEEQKLRQCQLILRQEGVDAARWLEEERGHLSSKKIAMKFPKLTSKIMEGSLNTDIMATAMAAESYPGDKKDQMKALLQMLADHVISTAPPNIDTEKVSKEMMGWLMLGYAEYRCSVEIQPERFPDKLVSIPCQDSLLWIFRRGMDHCLSSKEAKKCRMYVCSEEEFNRTVSELFDTSERAREWREMRKRVKILSIVLKYVQYKDHLVGCTCWECKKVVDETIMICSKCEFARYCSEECQKKAWENGHKGKCSQCKKGYVAFKRNLKVVKKANESPASHKDKYGLEPNQRVDLVACDVKGGTSPDMNMFYRSISRVLAGNLWVDPRMVTNRPMPVQKVSRELVLKKMVSPGFTFACAVLSGAHYDKGERNDPSSESLWKMWTELNPGGKGKKSPGFPMSPSEFLGVYCSHFPEASLGSSSRESSKATFFRYAIEHGQTGYENS